MSANVLVGVPTQGCEAKLEERPESYKRKEEVIRATSPAQLACELSPAVLHNIEYITYATKLIQYQISSPKYDATCSLISDT